MREITLPVYQFSELSEKAKQRAKDQYNPLDCDIVTDVLKGRLNDLGYGSCKLEWSLSYCQGDGVAFYGDVDVQDWWRKRGRHLFDKETRRKLMKEGGSFSIRRNSFGHHYSHYNTMYVEADFYDSVILADVKAVSKLLEAEGYKLIEEFQSDEWFMEVAECNGWEFFSNGQLV